MRMKKFFICCIAVSLLLAALPVTQVQALSLQKGFDVSSKNGVVDWEMVAESDMDFVMLRTGRDRHRMWMPSLKPIMRGQRLPA